MAWRWRPVSVRAASSTTLSTSGPSHTRPATCSRSAVIHCSNRNSVSPMRIRSLGRSSCWVPTPVPVHICAVRRVHVLDVDEAVAVVQARMPARRVRVVDRDLGRGARPITRPGPTPNACARGEAAAPLDHQPARVRPSRRRRAPRPPARTARWPAGPGPAARCAPPTAGTGRARPGRRTGAVPRWDRTSGRVLSPRRTAVEVPATISSPACRRRRSAPAGR